MGVVSGIAGKISKDTTIITHCRRWSISETDDLPGYVSSNSSGGMRRIAGAKDWAGQFEAIGYLPNIKPGDAFTFHGSIDGTDGLNALAMCEEIEVNINHESGESIGYRAAISGNGGVTYGAEDAEVDTALTLGQSPLALPVKVTPGAGGGAGVEVTLADIRSARLLFKRSLQRYVSNSTSGAAKRTTGPFDCSLTLSQYVDDLAASGLPAINNSYQVKVYCTASLFWDIKFMRLRSIEPDCDIESGRPVALNYNFDFTGAATVSGTPTIGYVNTPESTPVAWWP